MLAQGFRPVGRDFPVFLHPQTNEEYALARTERKSGRGYHGFTFHAAPDVTLEADLARRDLTINAMARDADGTLIDPYHGEADLRAGVLRHVSAAFAEDPLRVLRVARFAARLGFAVAPETEALMRAIVSGGELATLSPERVWQELARALMEARPSRFFSELRRCGALARCCPRSTRCSACPSRSRIIPNSMPACTCCRPSISPRRRATRCRCATRCLRTILARPHPTRRTGRDTSRMKPGACVLRRPCRSDCACPAIAANSRVSWHAITALYSARTSFGRRRCSTFSWRPTRCAAPSASMG